MSHPASPSTKNRFLKSRDAFSLFTFLFFKKSFHACKEELCCSRWNQTNYQHMQWTATKGELLRCFGLKWLWLSHKLCIIFHSKASCLLGQCNFETQLTAGMVCIVFHSKAGLPTLCNFWEQSYWQGQMPALHNF